MADIADTTPTVEAVADANNFPLSNKKWFQILDHCWRPLGGWVLIACLIYAFIIAPILDKHLNEGEVWAMVGLIAAMWGLKTFERTKGAPQ